MYKKKLTILCPNFCWSGGLVNMDLIDISFQSIRGREQKSRSVLLTLLGYKRKWKKVSSVSLTDSRVWDCLFAAAVVSTFFWGHLKKKICLSCLRPGKIWTSLFSYRDKLEAWKFRYGKCSFNTFEDANNIDADKAVWMHSLITAKNVHVSGQTDFLVMWGTESF